MIRTLPIAALTLIAGIASGQTVAITIDIDEPLLAPGQSTSVTLRAGFDPGDFAMAGVWTDLLASAPADLDGAWSEWAVVVPMDGPGTTAGDPDGAGGFTSIIAGQLLFPPASFPADPTNPIAFWTATFTAPLDGGDYWVDLSTSTSRYNVYLSRESSLSESRLDQLVEGQGRIFVVPAPATSAVLALGLLATRRRR